MSDNCRCVNITEDTQQKSKRNFHLFGDHERKAFISARAIKNQHAERGLNHIMNSMYELELDGV